MFGITPTNAMTIYVYSIDGTLINSFYSQVAVAKWLGVNQSTVSRHIKSGKVWNKLYVFRNLRFLNSFFYPLGPELT